MSFSARGDEGKFKIQDSNRLKDLEVFLKISM